MQRLPWLAMVLATAASDAQTPEQQQTWDAQRVQAQAAQRLRDAQIARDRASRRADPMAWVHTLDPMTDGGWQFRAVAPDGAWATFSTDHQMKRSGKLAVIWFREEFAEPQSSGEAPYLSVVAKTQYDCGRELERPLLVIYYSDNNLRGREQAEQSDPKATPWSPIVPGSRTELQYSWACAPVAKR